MAAGYYTALPGDSMDLNSLPKQYKGLGIRLPIQQKRRRLVMAVKAATKCGKTRLAFTMPKPLLFISLDMNTEGQEDAAIQEEQDGVYILEERIKDEVDKEHDLPQFKRIRKCVFDAVETKFFRSIAIDTGDALWDLCQRGFFGKEGFGAGGNQANYSVPNGAMTRIFKAVRESNDVNLMMIHRLAPERKTIVNEKGKKESVETGRMKMGGWKHTPFEVHTIVELGKDDVYECDKSACQGKAGCQKPELHDLNRYHATITDSQYYGERSVFRGTNVNFRNIAMAVHPITQESPEVWE